MPSEHFHPNIAVLISILAIHEECGCFNDMLCTHVGSSQLGEDVAPDGFSLSLKCIRQSSVSLNRGLATYVDPSGRILNL